MTTQRKLSDLGLPDQQEDFDSISLAQLGGGKEIEVSGAEFKELGKRDGVVLTLKGTVISNEGAEYGQIHTTAARVVKKLNNPLFIDALKGDSTVVMHTISGNTDNGKWVDFK